MNGDVEGVEEEGDGGIDVEGGEEDKRGWIDEWRC